MGPSNPVLSAWAHLIRRLAGAATVLAATLRRRRQAMSARSARRRFDYWIRAFTVTPYRARWEALGMYKERRRKRRRHAAIEVEKVLRGGGVIQ